MPVMLKAVHTQFAGLSFTQIHTLSGDAGCWLPDYFSTPLTVAVLVTELKDEIHRLVDGVVQLVFGGLKLRSIIVCI